jgi:ureidoglycolate lyase
VKTVKAEELSVEKFMPFGFYADCLAPTREKFALGIGGAIEFFPDMVQQDLGGVSVASYSSLRVAPRELCIDITEYHTKVAEVVLPLDGDVLMHVGPPSLPGRGVPLDKIRVFRVPRGTLVALRRGVWHHAPFTVNKSPVNMLIVLPERIYATDCEVTELPAADQIQIEQSI